MKRLSVRCGIWHSLHGEGAWPQGTHLTEESPRLIVCATGLGGGSQQAMFRSELDPLLQRAHSRWRQGYEESVPAAAELDRFFATIQHEFQELREPAWADQLSASAVALLIGSEDCAVANVWVDRAWVLRDGRLERLSEDYSLGAMADSERSALPEGLRDICLSCFGRSSEPARWQIRRVDLHGDDLFVMACGFCDIGVSEARLEQELKQVLSESGEEFSGADVPWRRSDRFAERLGWRLAQVAGRDARDEEAKRRSSWYLHSRLALAIVRVTAGSGL